MQISKRLEAVADMVTSGCRIVDVGTDHGYIPIFLIQNGKIAHAIAGDVNRGPLQKAVEHIRAYELEDKIETRLSDGLAAVQPGEADSIIIAGMGGPLTVRILTEGQEVAEQCQELILQPQSDIRQVRCYLEDNGWQIVREKMILEEGKFYPMMRAVKADVQTVPKMSETELCFGPLLTAQKDPVLREYLLRERQLNQRILDSLAGQEGEGSHRRQKEVNAALQMIGEVLALY